MPEVGGVSQVAFWEGRRRFGRFAVGRVDKWGEKEVGSGWGGGSGEAGRSCERGEEEWVVMGGGSKT